MVIEPYWPVADLDDALNPQRALMLRAERFWDLRKYHGLIS